MPMQITWWPTLENPVLLQRRWRSCFSLSLSLDGPVCIAGAMRMRSVAEMQTQPCRCRGPTHLHPHTTTHLSVRRKSNPILRWTEQKATEGEPERITTGVEYDAKRQAQAVRPLGRPCRRGCVRVLLWFLASCAPPVAPVDLLGVGRSKERRPAAAGHWLTALVRRITVRTGLR